MSLSIILPCPHCKDLIEILESEINCGIFRHGSLKINYQQIDPHLPKKICDELVEKNLIYGCGKPFQIIKVNNQWQIIPCDYI